MASFRAPGLWLHSSHSLTRVKRAPNSENESSEDSEADNRLKKIYFADLVKLPNQLQFFFFASRQFHVRKNAVT